MNNSTLRKKEKRRASSGKLKTFTHKRSRKSEAFSTSFTQKTMNNNASLAQSLAREKSRNEKLLRMQSDLIASRNEALMRLNEVEGSFERLGVLVKKGIKQLQDIATTMENIYGEIQIFHDNKRDSARMRSSLQEKNCQNQKSSSFSRMQTVKPMVDGHMITTQPYISLPRIDGPPETVAANESSPSRCSVLSTSYTVPAIEEEVESSDGEDDGVRNDSLISRTPRQAVHLESMQEFYNRVYAQDPLEGPSKPTRRGPQRLVRKVPKGLKLPGYNFEMDSSSDDGSVNNTTTLCLVDMDETIGAHSHTSNTVQQTTVEDNGSLPVKTVEEVHISPNVTYEEVFAISSANGEKTTTEDNVTRAGKGLLINTSPKLVNEAADIQEQKSPDSPEFLGFPNGSSLLNIKKSFGRKSVTGSKFSYAASKIESSSVKMKTSSDKPVCSKSSKGTSPNGNASDVHKVSEECLDSVYSIRSNKNSKVCVLTDKHSGKHEANTGKRKTSLTPKRLNCSSASNHKGMPSEINIAPTVLLSDVLVPQLTPVATGCSLIFDTQEHLVTENLPEAVRMSDLGLAKHSLDKNIQSVQTKVSSELDSYKSDVSSVIDVLLRKSGKQASRLNTPTSQSVEQVPLEIKSATECQKVLLIELERLPIVSRSAVEQPVTKKHKVSRFPRNIHTEDNENKAQTAPRKGKKRHSQVSCDAFETPTRGSKTTSPNAVLLVTKMNDCRNSGDQLEDSYSASNRRALRRIPPMNYKEPSINNKLRRPY